ncbi:hypothetical protein [Stenotrophomonas tumulicola]|uniref:Transmembrane protein n=1 Tax=Stenotrophomonas tumulicola TaxID=1685415 RepID=A0A7W3FPI1_9GAMM|nr:hypothetical protein [Stenotrophomonas tumulicola]MBA8683250.1 hypothetical protein [Stenotrophomonas tumulicola]
MDRSHRPGGEQGHEVLQRVRREGRWWWLQARHFRRIWRWTLLVAVVLFVALALLRRPLADWFWDEPRIAQLVEQGNAALVAGRLAADDGKGAREYFLAALALDNDRAQARDGLARTGMAALQAGNAALAEGDLPAASDALALARELQVPQAQSDALAEQLRQRRVITAGLDVVLQRARVALDEGRLDDDAESALPLLQRVLELRPQDVVALETREDALSDLLLRARQASERDDVALAADLLRRARGFDPGHADLPFSQETLSRALDGRVRRVSRAIGRGRLDAALKALAPALQAAPDEPGVVAQRDRLVAALLQDSRRLARGFHFDPALERIDEAGQLHAAPRELALARQEIQRARSARQAMLDAGTVPGAGREALVRLLERIAEAEARGRFLAPPGNSAYDALREAQALAPRDRRVVEAAARLLPASRSCFEDALRQNRLEAAGGCLQAWQTLAPTAAGLGPARTRLAQRWIAVGSERLGGGDMAYAETALERARQWQPGLAELAAFEQRVRQARGSPGRR